MEQVGAPHGGGVSWDLQAAAHMGDQTPIRGGTPNRLSVFFFQWVVHRNLPGSCT